jgi:outer membrane protein assembly factor BamB
MVMAILVLAPTALAQESATSGTTVYVLAHDEEMNKLVKEADKAAEDGDFRKAASLFDDAADRARSQVFRIGPRTYLGIREYVKSRIRSWPEKGLVTYRRVTDGRAKTRFEKGIRSGSTGHLTAVARQYPMSSFGARAMLALATRSLARGDTDSALRYLLEILRLYPDGEIPGVRRTDVIARAALAAAKRGDRMLVSEMKSRAARLPKDAKVAVAGGEQPLAAYLDALTSVPAGSRAPLGWTTPGGSPSRSGGRTGPDGPLTLYWAAEIPISEPADEEHRNSPILPVHPLIVGDEIIAPGHLMVQSLRLPPEDFVPTKKAIERLAPELVWSFPGEPDAEPGSNSREGQPPAFATAVGRLLTFPFRDPDLDWIDNDEELNSMKEVLLSLSLAAEGMLLDQRGASDPEHGTLLRGLTFHGAPAIVGHRLFVAGSRRPNRVETLVLAFDLSRGPGRLDPLWQTWVCEGSGTAAPMWRERYGGFDTPLYPSSVSTRNGIVYVSSNTGAVAAIDGETGEVLWIHTYEQAEQRPGLDARAVRARQTWFPNPPILDHRFLYVAPLDSDRLFVYFQMPDLRTGFVEHARFGRDEIVHGFDPEYLLGVRDGTVFLAGSTRTLGERPLFAVKSGPAFFATEEREGDAQRIQWRAEIEENAPRGRGVVAGDAIYFPTRKGIYRVDPATGAVTRLVGRGDPRIAELAAGAEVFGNLAVSGRWLVSASEERICLFGPAPAEKEEPEKTE